MYEYMLACGEMCFNVSKDVSFPNVYVVNVCIYVCCQILMYAMRVCMDVCMYAFVYACMYVFNVHADACVYLYACTCVIYVCRHVWYVMKCMHVCMYVCLWRIHAFGYRVHACM